MTTFIDEFLAGQATEDDIHDWIDEWHEGDSGEELHVFLGLTWPEYSIWVEDAELPSAESRKPGVLHKVRLQGGEEIFAHSVSSCIAPCPIHWPSAHHMRSWPQHWRSDRRIIERMCLHADGAVGHPDPDDPTRDKVHGCDGCCVGAGPEVAL